MKKIHIALLVMIIVAVGLFIKSSDDFGTYGSFSDAKSERTVKVVGTLADNPDIQYDPAVDANRFSFMMKDEKDIEKRVIVNQPIQQDFELSDQVVVIGKLENEIFVAEDILLKCPSKYKEEEIYVRTEKANM